MTSSSPTPTPTDGFSSCPTVNNTAFTSSNDRHFVLHCGIDYGNSESANLNSTALSEFSDCMNWCARTTDCTGCGWGLISGKNMCYLKTNLTTPHQATATWLFATMNVTSSDSS